MTIFTYGLDSTTGSAYYHVRGIFRNLPFFLLVMASQRNQPLKLTPKFNYHRHGYYY